MELRGKLTGIGASEGVAVGPVFLHSPAELEVERQSIARGTEEEEVRGFQSAVEAVVPKLSDTAQKMREEGNEDEAAIFDAHTELAQDPELAEGVAERVRGGESPEAAVLAVGEQYAQMFAAMEDSYMAARADDVRDVARQIAAEITGQGSAGLEALEEPSVILAKSLAPSDTARVPKGMALGFVTEEGSKTSHVSIMARSMGIPAVVGVGASLQEAYAASRVAVNGGEGYLVADPDEETISDIERLRRRLAEEQAELEQYKAVEGRTRGGRRVEVSANLGSAKEAEDALRWGAEGVGLFRTEFLFMEREELPTEEEQYQVYAEAARAFGENPIVFRTLDVGGDKDLPGVDQPEEENPFLGWRGIRMCLDEPELFKPQLRALLRAAASGNVKVMFPMIVNLQEVRSAKSLLEECEKELQREGKQTGALEVGVMVETPAAALCATEIAREVDFFSVGTNDLVQYTLAADRGNERLSHFQGAEHPAVLRLIGMTCQAAEEAGIWVGVCGEAAADPELIPELVELGVTELSMSAPSIPKAKKVVAGIE